jgi:uncharacterized membrane protein HdeD (DUF308 family)
MTTSILFARLIGPVMLVAAMSMLADREAIREVAEDFMNSPALIYLAGVLTLIMGVAIVTFHNFWVRDWRIIVTMFGYIAVLSGVFRMAFPTQVKQLGQWMLETKFIIRGAAALNVLLGAFLTWKGFFS